MKPSRRRLLSFVAASPLARIASAQDGASTEPILRAMTDELARSKQLRVLSNRDPLYFLEYALDDADGYTTAATLGAMISERRTRLRLPRVSVRIGSFDFDNTNYLFSDFYFGSRFDPEQFTLDDDYRVLRQEFWLATDRAFKGALEAIGRKRAALRNVTQADKLPDFSAAPPLQKILPVQRMKVDEALWRQRTVALSGIFSSYPEIFDSGVEFESMQTASYLVNTDGTSTLLPDFLFSVKTRASTQAADGMRLRNHGMIHSLDIRRLPSETELRTSVTAVANELKALAAAPLGDAYSGPVLFEGVAAAQLFAEMLSASLVSTRKPVSDPNRQINMAPSPFEGRIGSRVLPASFTVADDPTQKEWHGRPLLGSYPIDGEGVIPAPMTLIEKGVLKAVISTRTPGKDAATSNGRARMPGSFGAKAPGISNLFVKASDGVGAAELKAQFLKLVADRGKPYGIVVRKMDFPSTLPVSEIRRMMSAPERPTSVPVLVYKVFPDGKEELVRGLRFRGLSARSLKDILAASSDEFAFDFLGNQAPMSAAGAGGYVYTSTVVAPSVLFEDIEMERLDQDLPKLPVVPIPPSGD